MNLEEVLRDTKQAYVEAGIDNPDLSYITQEYIDDMEQNSYELSPDEMHREDPPEDIRREVPIDPEAQFWIWLWDVYFVGARVYGKKVDASQRCVDQNVNNLYWRSRSPRSGCPNRNSMIWFMYANGY